MTQLEAGKQSGVVIETGNGSPPDAGVGLARVADRRSIRNWPIHHVQRLVLVIPMQEELIRSRSERPRESLSVCKRVA